MAFPQRAAPQYGMGTPRQAANPQPVTPRPRGPARAIEQWYQLTAPDPRLRDSSLAGRELVRRGRLASIILLGLLTIWIFYFQTYSRHRLTSAVKCPNLSSVRNRIWPYVFARAGVKIGVNGI